MFALVYLYMACDGNDPFAVTIAVSDSKTRLIEEMNKSIESDCQIPEDEEDEWEEDMNYQVQRRDDDEVFLQHRKRINLYTQYKIHPVEIV